MSRSEIAHGMRALRAVQRLFVASSKTSTEVTRACRSQSTWWLFLTFSTHRVVDSSQSQSFFFLPCPRAAFPERTALVRSFPAGAVAFQSRCGRITRSCNSARFRGCRATSSWQLFGEKKKLITFGKIVKIFLFVNLLAWKNTKQNIDHSHRPGPDECSYYVTRSCVRMHDKWRTNRGHAANIRCVAMFSICVVKYLWILKIFGNIREPRQHEVQECNFVLVRHQSEGNVQMCRVRVQSVVTTLKVWMWVRWEVFNHFHP